MEHERIIHILDCLTKNTDETRSVTIADIQSYLYQNANVQNVSVITIRRDIDRLIGMGNDIRKTNGAHNTAYYSLVNGKGFDFNEIRFIVDSISINKFLSNEQKKKLIKKFEGMCSDTELRQLSSRILHNGVGAASLDLLENLDIIHRIIADKRKIDFEYGRFDTNHQMNYYSKRRDIIPVKVVYFNERFYLKCFDDTNEDFRTYRIDRMKNISAGNKTRRRPRLPKNEGFVADMFPPDRFETVTLKVKKFLLDEMLEQLGELANMRNDFDDPECVIVRFRAGINRQFYLWLMKYGDGLEIIVPDDIRREFSDELKKISEKYLDMKFLNI